MSSYGYNPKQNRREYEFISPEVIFQLRNRKQIKNIDCNEWHKGGKKQKGLLQDVEK